MEQIEKEKKKHDKIGERQSKKYRFSNQGRGQKLSGRDKVKWPKKK